MSSRGRDAVRMTEAEIWDFLDDSLKVQIATINRDGSPHLTTLFYAMQDGRIAFWTYASSQKIKNLERDPRISALVEDGVAYSELRGVSINGVAELVTDPDRVRAIGTAVAVRMAGGADIGAAGREGIQRQVPKRVGVIVTPQRAASWDHGKLR